MSKLVTLARAGRDAIAGFGRSWSQFWFESRPTTPLEEASQDDRVVVIFVVRRVDQGHCAPRRPAREIPERCASRRGLQLSPIAEGELSPAPRIMRKPAAQGVTRRDVLGPRVERKVLLSNAAGPEPIDEHAVPVLV